MSRNKITGESTSEWRGYDYDQLLFRSAVTKARIAIERERIEMATRDMRNNTGSMITRATRAFTWIDYTVLAIRLWRSLRPLWRKKRPER